MQNTLSEKYSKFKHSHSGLKYKSASEDRNISKPNNTTLNRLCVLLLTCDFIERNFEQYKDIAAHAKNKYKNYKCETKKKFDKQKISQAEERARVDIPKYEKRVQMQIARYKLRKHLINAGMTVAGITAAGVLTVGAIFSQKPAADLNNNNLNSSESSFVENEADLSAIEQDAEQDLEQDAEQDLEQDPEPETQIGEFIANYVNDADEQAKNRHEMMSFFEGSSKKGYSTISPPQKYDAAGFSWIQWGLSPGSQTANDFINTALKKWPEKVKAVCNKFGSDKYAELCELMKREPVEIRDFVLENFETWTPILSAIFSDIPEVRALQDADISKRMSDANDLSIENGFNSAMAVDYAYNFTVTDPAFAKKHFAKAKDMDIGEVTPEQMVNYLQARLTSLFMDNHPDFEGLMAFKLDYFNNLKKNNPEALAEYYRLVFLEASQFPSANQNTRGKAALGLGGSKDKNGNWSHGYEVYKNTSLQTDMKYLEAEAKPQTLQGLQAALFDAGYELDEIKQSILIREWKSLFTHPINSEKSTNKTTVIDSIIK